MTKQEREAAIQAVIADPEKFKRESTEEIRREYPEMTEEQIEASWDQLAHQFGF